MNKLSSVRSLTSRKASCFTESVIREMTRLAAHYDAVNLGQGMPDFACPRELKRAACQAINADINQYAITWGARDFREAIARKCSSYLNLTIDPEREITVTCGSTEGMIAAMLATVDPGDEVIVFEPYYENYGPDAILSGASPRYVRLHPPDWSFSESELKAAFSDRTKAIIINTPNNPTGKVFTRQELELIASLCQKWGALAITDEIYEHILYDGRQHIAIASLPGMENVTVTINSLSKTYSVTGWRVGYIIAGVELTQAVRKVHDFLTVGAPAPLQVAGAAAMRLGADYYEKLARDYTQMRQAMLDMLERVGIPYFRPEGAYYVLTDISGFDFPNDVKFAEHLVREVGVAVVPGSSFYSNQKDGANYVRFCFSRKLGTLAEAGRRLEQVMPVRPV